MAEPHFLLFCDTHVGQTAAAGPETTSGVGRWHFVLEQIDGADRLEAGDAEVRATRDRLDLLAVVRGLEALEQPSKVTLVTTSRYVARGLRYGLGTWRESDYRWERFGVQLPIRNADLWQRVDVAMTFHGVNCRLIQSGQRSFELLEEETATGHPRLSAGEMSTGKHGWETSETCGQPTPQGVRRPQPGPWVGERQTNGMRAPAGERGLAAACRAGIASMARLESWWKITISWFYGWRSRLQNHSAAYGT